MRDSMWRTLPVLLWLCVGCTASATGPGGGAPDGATVAGGLTPGCGGYCTQVVGQCGGPAAGSDKEAWVLVVN